MRIPSLAPTRYAGALPLGPALTPTAAPPAPPRPAAVADAPRPVATFADADRRPAPELEPPRAS